jgi:hypothetical protein
MALTLNRLIGFESGNYDDGGEIAVGTSLAPTGTSPTDSGEFGCGLLNISASASFEVAYHTADAGVGWVIGFAIKFENTLSQDAELFRIWDPGSGTWFMRLGLDSAEQWTVSPGQMGGTGITSSMATPITTSQWYYVEIFCNPETAAGDISVFVDGVEVIDGTMEQRTSVAGSPTHIKWEGSNQFQTIIDDCYILTGAAVRPTGGGQLESFRTGREIRLLLPMQPVVTA